MIRVHKSRVDCLPSELDKWLYMLTIQVAWIGLRTESRRSTSTSWRTIPEPSWLWICAEYQDVNWSFINFFASLLTVKSSSDEDKWLDFLLDIFMWNLCKLPLLITLDKMQNGAYQGIIYYLCRYINCTCRCWLCLSSSLWFKFLTVVFNFAIFLQSRKSRN